MRTNGLIYVETRTAGGLNEWGEPLGDTVAWGDPIPCSADSNTDSRLGKYEDGEFRQASYTVLIESRDNFEAERIRLVVRGKTVGEFRVVSIRELTLGRIQILV